MKSGILGLVFSVDELELFLQKLLPVPEILDFDKIFEFFQTKPTVRSSSSTEEASHQKVFRTSMDKAWAEKKPYLPTDFLYEWKYRAMLYLSKYYLFNKD